jgi:hypothetical protein
MRATIVAALVALALPASALASTPPKYFIPPGNSSGNQYVESIPTAGGKSSTNGVTHSGGGHGTLPPRTQSALVSQGHDGAQAAAFANATGNGPQSGGSGSTHARHGAGGTAGGSGGGGRGGAGGAGGGASSGAGNGSNAGAVGSSPAASVAHSLTGLGGQGGLGWLPFVLLAVALGLAAIAILRRRHAS